MDIKIKSEFTIFLEQQISMLQWFLKDHVTHKPGVMILIFQFGITGINYIFKYLKIENNIFHHHENIQWCSIGGHKKFQTVFILLCLFIYCKMYVGLIACATVSELINRMCVNGSLSRGTSHMCSCLNTWHCFVFSRLLVNLKLQRYYLSLRTLQFANLAGYGKWGSTVAQRGTVTPVNMHTHTHTHTYTQTLHLAAIAFFCQLRESLITQAG